MIILSRHSLFHYLHYLVMNRDKNGNEFLENLHSDFSGVKVGIISQKTRNILFEIQLAGKSYVIKHYIPIVKGKEEAFNNEVKSAELAKEGFALPPLFVDEVSKVLVYEKCASKSYLYGLEKVKEEPNTQNLKLFSENTARFLAAFHDARVTDIPLLGYQDVLKTRSKVPVELTKELISFCCLWKSSGVIHGDAHGGNLFCDNLALNMKLLDWETLRKADPYYDLALFFRSVAYTICGGTFFNGKRPLNDPNSYKFKIYIERFAENYDSFNMPKMNIFFKVVNADLYKNANYTSNIDYIFTPEQ